MKEKETRLYTLNCVWISYLHTIFAASAFAAALVVGCALHYHKIVENEHYGFPDEWFPSVSATIGDRYPERSVYQVLIALTSGPRFLLSIVNYILARKPQSRMPEVMLITGILRTLTCGGWTYVTSTDDHDWHDIFMISYIVLTIPWTVTNTLLTPKGPVRTQRFYVGSAFFAMLVPLIYFFLQHKVHRVAGAYTIYAFFEWSLIILDVGFDSLTSVPFQQLEVSFSLPVGSKAKGKGDSKGDSASADAAGAGTLPFFVASFNWFVWWSVLTSFGVLIWYFPLWYMGISGYEALLLVLVAPFILVVGPLRRLLQRFPQLSLLGTTAGIAAYWAQKPTDRVCVVALGCAFAAVSASISFSNATTQPLGGQFQSAAFLVGLISSAVAKMWLWSNNPIWPVMNSSNGGLNLWGLVAAVVGSIAVWQRPAKATIFTPNDSWVLSGLGVGSLLFALLTWVSDTSALPLWVWEGYPVRGPTPLPHGFVTLVGVALGLVGGLRYPRLAVSSRLSIVGFASFVVVQNLKHWSGYFGGLLLVVWLSAVTPQLLASAGRHNPAKSFGLGFFVLVLFILGETWTVAYAFVPGGPALRERTWLIMGLNTAGVVAGAYNVRKWPAPAKVSTASSAYAAKLLRIVTAALGIVLALGAVVTMQRLQHVTPAPRNPDAKSLTTGIWTIHFGLDNDMWASETRMMQLIDEMELDVIGLLESDTQRIIGGHRDMTQRIAEELGFYADYGPGPNKHTWGCALLSRFPIVNSTHHLLPSPVGELAPAIHATLDVFGEFVDVFVFHSGQEEDPEDRRLQTKYLTEIFHEQTRPSILLSYLVTKPKEGNYNTWVSEFSGMHDIDNTDWDRWCEYILYKGIKRTGYARVSRSTITDTELQVGRFVVGQEPDYSDTRVDESEVAANLRFPSLFRGEGVRGHRYHVFDEPRYFA